jgi:histidinol-phosphate phosphatase family protein
LAKPIIFLDRDGTLIAEQDYLKDPRKVKLLAGVSAALRRLNRAGYPLVVISNQSGVGRGLMTRSDVRRVMAALGTKLGAEGVKLSGVYWCPHHPDDRCRCRKPNLELVRRAAKQLHRTFVGSISIGDKWIDVELGQRTGGQGILVLTGYGPKTISSGGTHPRPDYVARNLVSAVAWILKNEKRR